MRFSITFDITLKYTRICGEIPAKIFKFPSPFPSPRRGEGGGEGAKSKKKILRFKHVGIHCLSGMRQKPLIQNGIFDSISIKIFQKSGGVL
jgi:hypothetical protein